METVKDEGEEVRNSFVDNAKVILILLVVLGHLMSGLLGETKWFDTVYLFIYTFHMPAFVYITGALSKKPQSVKQFYKLALCILAPYFIFQIIYTVYYERVFNERINFEWLTPRMALWYLLSLFVWRIALIIIPKSSWSIVGAVIVSLFLGNVAEINDWASLSRTIFFFVYFIAGHKFGFAIFESRGTGVKVLRLLGVLMAFMLLYYFGDISYRNWLLGKSSYSEMGTFYFEYGPLNRLFVYIIGFSMLTLFFYFVPTREVWYTKYGSRTLSVYLLHLFVVKMIRESEMYECIGEEEQYWLLLLFAFAITALFSMKVFQNILSPIKCRQSRRAVRKNAPA